MRIFRGIIIQLLAGIATVFAPVMVLAEAPMPQVLMEQIQVPQCLAAHMGKYRVLAENEEFKIIEVPSAELDDITLLADKVGCGRFINVSHDVAKSVGAPASRELAIAQLQKPASLPVMPKKAYVIKHPDEVNAAINKIDASQLWDTILHLTNYTNRSATTDTGVQTAHWLKKMVNNAARENGYTDIKTYFVQTGSYYIQPSLVTVIGKNIKAPAVVIGAHMDTLSGTMPGAGDNASGSAVLLTMLRTLLKSDYAYKRPIYIIWYAAEERGLVGSQYVVRDFQAKKIPVYAVVQLDMAGHRNNAKYPTMWVFRDYTDTRLSNFLARLIKTYIKVPVKYSKCGYGCSDHASWTRAGIPAAFPCETSFEKHNPYIHTDRDTTSLLNIDHLTNFTKLALAYVIELALD